MTFANNLRFLRKKNNLSQDYVADKLGYKTYTTVQKWESGVSEPNMNILRALAEMFDVSMNDLINADLENPNYKRDETAEYLEKNNPELLEIYNSIRENDNLVLLFDKTKDLSPEDMERILTIIKGIRAEKGMD